MLLSFAITENIRFLSARLTLSFIPVTMQLCTYFYFQCALFITLYAGILFTSTRYSSVILALTLVKNLRNFIESETRCANEVILLVRSYLCLRVTKHRLASENKREKLRIPISIHPKTLGARGVKRTETNRDRFSDTFPSYSPEGPI